jgi:hypothetical protein
MQQPLKRRLKQFVKFALWRWFPLYYDRPTRLRIAAIREFLRDIPAAVRLRSIDLKKLRTVNLSIRRKRVVFVSDQPFRREPKFAYALRKAGWEVVQLFRDNSKFSDYSDFADMQRYTSVSDAVTLAHKSGARIFHNFAAHCDETTLGLLNRKPGRVIVDLYDSFYAISDNLPEMRRRYRVDVAKQRDAIARADAVSTPDIQLAYRRKETQLARGKPLICFPNYCWDRLELPTRPKSSEVHIVQAGWILFETRGETDDSSFLTAREFVNAGCHFHIYMHPLANPPMESEQFAFLYGDYLALGASTGRVHIHPTVPSHQLPRELAQYDYGFNMINASNFPNIPWKTQNPAWLRYLASARLFDYLDAGLGMIADGNLAFNRHLFRNTGSYFNGTGLLKSRKIYETLRDKPSRDQILKARRDLSVERNIHRLIRFYESLA